MTCAHAIEGLERLIDCGRSSKYGFRRHAILNPGKHSGREAGPAIRRAVAALNSCPASSYALQEGGISRRARGPEALAAARKALKEVENGASSLAHVVAALAFEDLCDRKNALRHLDLAAVLEPREGWIFQFRGDVRRREGDFEGFISDCEAAILLDEGAAYFRFAAGDVRSRSRRRTLEAADRYLAAHPDAYWMYVFRGDCKRFPEINDFSGAIADFEKALALRPACSYAWAYLSRARMVAGPVSGALSAIDRAIALEPDCGWFHVWRGEVRRRQGLNKEALKDFNKGLALDGGYEFGYAWRGGALRSLGRAEEALRDLDTAARLDPAYAWTFHERSLALRDLGRIGESLSALAEALSLDPKLSWCSRPESFPAALAQLERELKADPKSFWAFAWRGEIKNRMGDYQSAKSDLDKALSLKPGHAWVLSWRGRALWGLGKPREALKDLDRAVRVDPAYANSWAWRGRIRHELATSASRPRKERL